MVQFNDALRGPCGNQLCGRFLAWQACCYSDKAAWLLGPAQRQSFRHRPLRKSTALALQVLMAEPALRTDHAVTQALGAPAGDLDRTWQDGFLHE